jgi:hypothetical protein
MGLGVDVDGVASRAGGLWSGGVVTGDLLAKDGPMAKDGFGATLANDADDESLKGPST